MEKVEIYRLVYINVTAAYTLIIYTNDRLLGRSRKKRRISIFKNNIDQIKYYCT